MKLKYTLLCTLLSVDCMVSAEPLDSGDRLPWTFGIQGAAIHTSLNIGDGDMSMTQYMAQGSLGKFLTNNVELEGMLGWMGGSNQASSSSSSESGNQKEDTNMLLFSAKPTYHFLPFDKFDPYVGLNLGVLLIDIEGSSHYTSADGNSVRDSTQDYSDTAFAIGLPLGCYVFLDEPRSMALRFEYQPTYLVGLKLDDENGNKGDDAISMGQFLVGFSYFW